VLREQRQQTILEEMERAGSVSVAALSRKIKVSDMTVRPHVPHLLSGEQIISSAAAEQEA